MSQNDIDNGRIICEVGVAAVAPSEFVIFRITFQLRSEGLNVVADKINVRISSLVDCMFV